MSGTSIIAQISISLSILVVQGYAYISKYRIDVLCMFVGYGEK